MTVASQLACGKLSEALFIAAKSFDEDRLQQFLAEWRDQLCHELSYDPQGLLGHQYKKLANNMSDAFPSMEVMWLYARPMTSCSVLGHVDHAHWIPRYADIDCLTQCCKQWFSWGTAGTMGDIFSKHVWPGCVLCTLIMVSSLVSC